MDLPLFSLVNFVVITIKTIKILPLWAKFSQIFNHYIIIIDTSKILPLWALLVIVAKNLETPVRAGEVWSHQPLSPIFTECLL